MARVLLFFMWLALAAINAHNAIGAVREGRDVRATVYIVAGVLAIALARDTAREG